jgi:hypothetical protein
MAAWRDEAVARANAYANRYGLVLEQAPDFGFGVHGIVLPARCQPGPPSGMVAIKAHYRPESYERERNVYMRLKRLHAEKVRTCNVPQLIGFDDELWVIEMSIVQRPFVLDFAGAYLDEPPDYPAETLEEWRKEKQEQFEEDWPEVQRILAELTGFGVYMADVSPGNIAVRRET